MVGTGEYSSVPEVCGAVIGEAARVEPEAAAAKTYERGHKVYQRLYPALKAALQTGDTPISGAS
jgi:xylulokinase